MKKAILGSVLFIAVACLAAEIPPAEHILPADTLAMVTVPDFTRLKEANLHSPQGQLWHDPSMKAFVDKFTEKLTDEYIAPLEKDLGVTLSNYFPLMQGQVTMAYVQNGWSGGKDKPQPGWLLLLDSKKQSDQLKTNLAILKRKWTDADKSSRTERIRDVEFTVLKVSTNDVPPTLQKLLPSSGPKFPDSSADSLTTPKSDPVTVELYIGQYDSLLIAGNQPGVIEKVLASLTGGGAPTLSENAAFEANRLSLFRDAQFYGWANTKTITDLISKQLAKNASDDSGSASFTPFKPEKVIGALGLDALKSLAFSMRVTADGSLGELYLTVPESDRRGLFTLIEGEPKEVLPPSFVPADAIKFQRVRLDTQKTWDNIEKTLGTLSPQLLAGLNFAVEMAGGLAKEKNPDYDLKKSLLGSLGDDIITYEKAPKSSKLTDMVSPPAITLVGTTKPDQFLEAVKYLLTGTNQRGEAPKEREFRGRKIYTMEMSPVRTPDGKAGPDRSLSFSAANGYGAFSTDPAMLEEFLRGSEDSGKPLRETPGLTEAAAKVTGSHTSWLSYENQAESMRATISTLKKTFGDKSDDSDTSAFGIPSRQKFFTEWFDVSALPDFDKIAKYFNMSLTTENSSGEGISFKMYTPIPPQLKPTADTKN